MKPLKTKKRNTFRYYAACVSFVVAIGFAVAATYTNPSIVGFAMTVGLVKQNPQTEYETYWDYAPFLLNSTLYPCTVQANFTLSGNDLSVGEPVSLRVNMSIQEPMTPYVSSVSVQLENTFQSLVPYTQTIGLGVINESLGRRLWLGNGLFEFNTVGPVVATISIYTLDRMNRLGTINLGKGILSNLIIGPSETGQALFYENQNLSLTLFILFFAALDIAVTLYDHAYEDEKEHKNDAKDKHNESYRDGYCPE